jgi:DNA-binding transcriptional MerR regulator
MSSKYSIKDLERLSGIKAHTLRIWEQRYDILNPERTSTNIRYYSNEDLKKILNVSLLNNNGYKISNIARLSPDSLLNEASKLFGNYEKESNQIENLMLSLLEWDEFRFEETVNQSISHFGFENTIEKIIFPFLRQLGNMWQVGVVNPAQEHFMTNLIRQKIIVEIDKTSMKPISGSKKYVFFLPNNELHEMGLLYTYYLCKQKGHSCLYLGQSVPFEDVLSVAKLTQPDFLVTILTSNSSEEETQEFLKKCDVQIPTAFLISGRLIVSPESKIKMPSEKFKVFKEFSDYKMLL